MVTRKTSPSSKAVYGTIALLIIFASLAVSVRLGLKGDGDLPTGDSAWTLSTTLQVVATEKGATIAIPPPWDTRYSRLFAQSLSHSGLRQKRIKSEVDKRDIVLVAAKAGSYTTEAIFSIHVSALARSEPNKQTLSEQNRAQWLSASEGVSINTPATLAIVERLTKAAQSPEEIIGKLFDYVSSNIRIDQRASSDSEIALSKKRGTALGSIRALTALLRTAHLPARMVTGVNLQVTAKEQPFFWLEVYDAESWLPLDPVHGYIKQLPAFYIPLRKADGPLVTTENARVMSTVWKIDTAYAPRSLLSSDRRKLSDILDLNRLSPASRENLGVLLLLPLGVLATEIMRQLIGIRTYGTFTPSLLALAVVHVEWRTAMIIFMLVTVIGVAIRSFLPKLNLQRTPLLAIVFTLVSLSMAIVVSGFIYFDPAMDSIVVLLPVVVLTMLVDRIYSVADERGMRTALVRLFWTTVSALISLLILLQAEWGTWLVAYPEIHAITLACIIMIGLYQGPKLRDFAVLHWLHEPAVFRSRRTDKKARSAKAVVEKKVDDEMI